MQAVFHFNKNNASLTANSLEWGAKHKGIKTIITYNVINELFTMEYGSMCTLQFGLTESQLVYSAC